MSEPNRPKSFLSTVNPLFWVFSVCWLATGVAAFQKWINFTVATLIAAGFAVLAFTVGRDLPRRQPPPGSTSVDPEVRDKKRRPNGT